MGHLSGNLKDEVTRLFRSKWEVKQSLAVPDVADIPLGATKGSKIDATILYADLAESTKLVDEYGAEFAATVFKAYLLCSSSIIADNGGAIVSFDGDRVMAVFPGSGKNTAAVRAAFSINNAVINVITPTIKNYSRYSDYKVMHGIGIDTSPVLAARTGIRGRNDLVWVGRCANYAAKLASMRHLGHSIIVTESVYDVLHSSMKARDLSHPVNFLFPAWRRLSNPFENLILYGSNSTSPPEI